MNTTPSADREVALQRLLDEHAIERLMRGDYPFPMDAGDLEGVVDGFAHARLIFEGSGVEVEGREALREFWPQMCRVYEGGATYTRHYVTNTVVDVDDSGEHATARSYYLTTQCVPDRLPLQVILSGEYLDTLDKVDGAWRIVERRFARLYFGDLSAHAPSAQEWDVPS